MGLSFPCLLVFWGTLLACAGTAVKNGAGDLSRGHDTVLPQNDRWKNPLEMVAVFPYLANLGIEKSL